MYYLNDQTFLVACFQFLRIEFICIIWTNDEKTKTVLSSWGLNLFVLFEPEVKWQATRGGSWGLNLFVLFEPSSVSNAKRMVLEDWIYLYYLNGFKQSYRENQFLRIEFICIIWTQDSLLILTKGSWGLNLFVLFEQSGQRAMSFIGSWGLNLFVLFEPMILPFGV